jgi:hypothetical protein
MSGRAREIETGARKLELGCDAITWQKTPEGMDYVECDSTAAQSYTLSGLLLSVRAQLCEAHRKAFEKMGCKVIVR